MVVRPPTSRKACASGSGGFSPTVLGSPGSAQKMGQDLTANEGRPSPPPGREAACSRKRPAEGAGLRRRSWSRILSSRPLVRPRRLSSAPLAILNTTESRIFSEFRSAAFGLTALGVPLRARALPAQPASGGRSGRGGGAPSGLPPCSPDKVHPGTSQLHPAGSIHGHNCLRDLLAHCPRLGRLLDMDAVPGNPVDQVVRAESLEFRVVPGSADLDSEWGIQTGHRSRDRRSQGF
jgi:hypothetical protein